jgi:hypothetical protein
LYLHRREEEEKKMNDHIHPLEKGFLTDSEYKFLLDRGFTHALDTKAFFNKRGYHPDIGSIFTSPGAGGSHTTSELCIHNGTLLDIAGWTICSKRSIQEASKDYQAKVFGNTDPESHGQGAFVCLRFSQ